MDSMAASRPSLPGPVPPGSLPQVQFRLTSPALRTLGGAAQAGFHSQGAWQQIGPTSQGGRKSSWARPQPVCPSKA